MRAVQIAESEAEAKQLCETRNGTERQIVAGTVAVRLYRCSAVRRVSERVG